MYSYDNTSSNSRRMRNVSEKSCVEDTDIYLIFNLFFFPENRAVYEMLWKNMIELYRPQMTI
jgi:hypothetical protein